MTSTQLTEEYLLVLSSQDDRVRNFLRRETARSYEEFLDVLYDDLKIAIERLETNPQEFGDESEDATTNRLTNILFGMGYTVEHNVQAGGNVDITVQLVRKNFKWIAEAKKFKSVGDMREGYLQLATRYRPGMGADGVLYGGMMGYLRRPKAAQAMRTWRAHLPSMVEAKDAQISDCKRRGPFGFESVHEHQDFGTPFRVWHNVLVLNFAPKDASARQSVRHGDGSGP